MLKAARARGRRDGGGPRKCPAADRGRDGADQPERSALLDIGVNRSMERHVEELAALAHSAGIDGVVASPQELKILRAAVSRRSRS